VADHVLCALTTGSERVASRICGVLAQRQIDVRSVQMTQVGDNAYWWVRLVVRASDESQVEMVAKWLERLIDVLNVFHLDASAEGRSAAVASSA
jgi:acetolactate synthase small subunit